MFYILENFKVGKKIYATESPCPFFFFFSPSSPKAASFGLVIWRLVLKEEKSGFNFYSKEGETLLVLQSVDL